MSMTKTRKPQLKLKKHGEVKADYRAIGSEIQHTAAGFY